ncbi:histone H1-like [Aphidius gifuensis]|uniref:histone H1-like n=1 Tax=Aphidius gifuensis TaxID=684658 RepID=UPI001CDCD41C|nr:histone H1-like [Aphidius gifuensis]
MAATTASPSPSPTPPDVITSDDVETAIEKKTASPKVSKVKQPKISKESSAKAAAHPSTADMVNSAIKALADRKGSSLQAIKKYLSSEYKLDTKKHAIFIRKYLNSAANTGALVRTKGNGALGSFKIADDEPVKKPKAKIIQKKTVTKKNDAVIKKTSAKKITNGDKKIDKSPTKKPAAKKSTDEKKSKPSPKAKKATKGPLAKPKIPKAKKTAVTTKNTKETKVTSETE